MSAGLTTVLIVDDEPAVRDLIARWASALGVRPRTAATAAEALATLRTQDYDLAVIDVMMPGRDGLWLAGELTRAHPDTAIVIATARADLVVAGGDPAPFVDYLVKPFPRERFALAVDRGRQWRKEALDDRGWQRVLATEVHDRAAEICASLRARADSGPQGEAEVLSRLALARMPEVAAHSQRVARFADSIGRELRLDGDAIRALDLAARFHDVGKLTIPETLLNKPGPLTAGERAVVRLHVDIGAGILDATRTLRGAAEAVRASHEWFDGSGYPRRLASDAIPLPSRIIAAADAYDAMTHQRGYRAPLDATDAFEELNRGSGRQFDPRIVSALLALLTRQ